MLSAYFKIEKQETDLSLNCKSISKIKKNRKTKNNQKTNINHKYLTKENLKSVLIDILAILKDSYKEPFSI